MGKWKHIPVGGGLCSIIFIMPFSFWWCRVSDVWWTDTGSRPLSRCCTNTPTRWVFCPIGTSTNKCIVLNVIFMTLYLVRGQIEPCWPDLGRLFVSHVWSFPWLLLDAGWLVGWSDFVFTHFLLSWTLHGRWLEHGSDMRCIHVLVCLFLDCLHPSLLCWLLA